MFVCMRFARFPSCLHYQSIYSDVLFEKIHSYMGPKDSNRIALILWPKQSAVESTFKTVSAPSVLAACNGAKYPGANEATVCQLTKQQQLPVVRIHRPGRFRKGLLDDWLDECNKQT